MDVDEYFLMDSVEERMWWYRAAHAHALGALERRLGQPGLILDAGCGTGGFLSRLREHRPDANMIGVDYFPAAAARAREKSGAPTVTGSVNMLPFADASFKAVISLDVLCHRQVEPLLALVEFRRVLAPGGVVVLNLPAFQWLYSAHDVRVHTARRFTKASLRTMLANAGFGAIEIFYWNALLFPLMILQRKVFRRGRQAASDVEQVPSSLDRLFHRVALMEQYLRSSGVAFPAGGSVLATATRP